MSLRCMNCWSLLTIYNYRVPCRRMIHQQQWERGTSSLEISSTWAAFSLLREKGVGAPIPDLVSGTTNTSCASVPFTRNIARYRRFKCPLLRRQLSNTEDVHCHRQRHQVRQRQLRIHASAGKRHEHGHRLREASELERRLCYH